MQVDKIDIKEYVHPCVDRSLVVWDYAFACPHIKQHLSSYTTSQSLKCVLETCVGLCEIQLSPSNSITLDFSSSSGNTRMLEVAARLEHLHIFKISYPSATSILLIAPDILFSFSVVFKRPLLRLTAKGKVHLRDPSEWADLADPGTGVQSRRVMCKRCTLPNRLQESILRLPIPEYHFIGTTSNATETNLILSPRRKCCLHCTV